MKLNRSISDRSRCAFILAAACCTALVPVRGAAQRADATRTTAPPGTFMTHAVEASGSTVFLGMGTYLLVIDASEPSAPREIGRLKFDHSILGIAISGERGYLACGQLGLEVIDVSNPAAPSKIGSYDTRALAWDVVIQGERAYVADGGAGLLILDVSDPRDISLLGTFDTAEAAFGVFVEADTAYVADGTAGFVSIDVSDPASPREIATVDTPGFALKIVADGGRVFVADSREGLRIYGTSNPGAPDLVVNYPIRGGAGAAYDLVVDGRFVFVAEGMNRGDGDEFERGVNGGFVVLDLSDRELLYSYGNTPGLARAIAYSAPYIYVADGGPNYFSGLHIYLIPEDPFALLPVGSFDRPDDL